MFFCFFYCFIARILAAGNINLNATKLTSVAMKENQSDIIEVRLANLSHGLEVLQNQKILSFAEQSWMDLHGEIHFFFFCSQQIFLPVIVFLFVVHLLLKKYIYRHFLYSKPNLPF